MNNRINKLLITVIAVLACGSNAWAGCNNQKFAGTWDVAFSDGNSCRLVLDPQGEVIADESTCFDPFRGTTTPDSGSYDVANDCSISANIVVEGVPVELAGQFSSGRNIGAGRFLVSAFFVKGGYTMVRVP